MNFNQVTIMGRLTRDPDTRTMNSGAVICSTGIAFDDGFGDNKKTVFIDLKIWNKTADVVSKYCQKGSPVLISGRISMDTWDDRNTGDKRSKLYITADRVQLISTRDGSGRDAGNHRQEQGQSPSWNSAPPANTAATPPPVNNPLPPPMPPGDESVDDIPF